MQKLFVFNPGHEEALLHHSASSYTPRQEVRQLMYDLGHLMLLLCDEGDYVALITEEGLCIIDHLSNPVSPQDLPSLELTPWALEPHLIAYIAKHATALGISLSLPFVSRPYLSLSHRSSSTRLLHYLIEQGWNVEDLIPEWLHASEDLSLELDRCLTGFMTQGHLRLIAKRPFSSSGRGVMPIDLPADAACRKMLFGQCCRSGSISLEPWLQIEQDWAVEYYYSSEGARYIGLSRFDTKKGLATYEGNQLASETELRGEIIRHIGQESWERLTEGHRAFLAAELGDTYTGYIGVDMCLYKQGKELRLHPAVEINVRCTMGLLAHEAYLRYIEPMLYDGTTKARYRFQLDYYPEKGAAFQSYLAHLRTEHSSLLFIPLTKPTQKSHYYTYLAPR